MVLTGIAAETDPSVDQLGAVEASALVDSNCFADPIVESFVAAECRALERVFARPVLLDGLRLTYDSNDSNQAIDANAKPNGNEWKRMANEWK